MKGEFVIFSGSSNPQLASSIAGYLGTSVSEAYLHSFPSGEKYCQLKENVRERDVFIIQSTNFPANDNLMELLVMVDAAKRASAARITVVIPSTPCYSRQDRKDKSRTPISAKLVANIITASGADRLLGMDFHCPQFAGFFDIPVDQLYAAPVFADYIHNSFPKGSKIVAVSPDEGAIKRTVAIAKSMGFNVAIHCKKRTGDVTVESQGLIGNVKDMHVVLFDDITESVGTLMEAARVCKENGALTVTAFVSHNALTDVGMERLRSDTDRALNRLVITDTNRHKSDDFILDHSFMPEAKIHQVSVAALFARAIMRIHNGESLSELFDIKGF